ncbi:MAG: BACON domain-containing protein, partial [Odoribacter sp.]|nr:BACON domain-containing protein [Odoribacter sp.]
MKKRMWLWCLIAALGLSINVACESDDESEDIVPPTGGTQIVPPTGGEQTPLPSDSIPVPPSTEVIWVDTIQVPETELAIGYEGGTVSFVTTTNQTYWIEVEKGVDWLTISDEGRAVKDYPIVATVEKNVSKNERTATITINFDDAEDTSVDVKITQEGRPATATIEFEVECPNGPGYVNVSGQYNVAELIAGCDPDMEPQLGYENEEGEMVWQNWSVTDGWFGPDGPMNWGAGCIVCIKPNADGSFNHISAYPGVDPTEIVVYINYGNDVILEVTAIITPEEVEETNEYTIVETITVERTVTFVPGHGIVPESYTLDMAAITEKIGGTPNEFLMSRPDGKFQDWSTTDGWFGEGGAVAWGSGSALKCLKPQADGTFADDCCHPDAEASLPIVANCTYRYGNTETMKAVDVKFAVTIQAEAEVVLPDFAITPEAGVVEVAADGATTYEAQIIAKDGYTLVKYIYDSQYGMTNIYSEYQECWYTIEEGENGKVEVTFEANAKPEARKAYLYAMPTSVYETLGGDIDGFFTDQSNPDLWEPSEQAAQYLVAEFHQAAGEVDDTFEFDPMGEVVEVAADASTYFTATINCPAGYTLIKYDYTEWGMTNIYSEYQDFWCWVNDDNNGNIEVNFEINDNASPRKAYLYVMPTSVYETLGGDIDGFFTDQSNPDLWEPSEQAAQYLIAEFHQEAG